VHVFGFLGLFVENYHGGDAYVDVGWAVGFEVDEFAEAEVY